MKNLLILLAILTLVPGIAQDPGIDAVPPSLLIDGEMPHFTSDHHTGLLTNPYEGIVVSNGQMHINAQVFSHELVLNMGLNGVWGKFHIVHPGDSRTEIQSRCNPTHRSIHVEYGFFGGGRLLLDVALQESNNAEISARAIGKIPWINLILEKKPDFLDPGIPRPLVNDGSITQTIRGRSDWVITSSFPDNTKKGTFDIQNDNIFLESGERIDVSVSISGGEDSGSVGGSRSEPLAGSRPNIILVMTDDQGMGDLSCMGNPILRTPNLDSFYEISTRFTDFHVSPTCAPTRSAMMSGRAPFKNGVTHTILQRERMALDTYTFPQALQSAGYNTGLFGKWHLGDEEAYLPQNRGFDEVLMHGAGGIGQVGLGDFPPNGEDKYFDNVLLHNNTIVRTNGFCTDLFFQSALAWIKKQHEAKVPYFAYIALNAPHGPFIAPEDYKNRFLEAGYDESTAGRYGMIENIDDNFGRLMTYLRKWQALENTLVIFMTDNGMSMRPITKNGESVERFNAGLRSYKNSPYEGGTHVPAFWYWQGVLEEGVDIPALTAHIDLYQTFSELAGAKLPEQMQEMDGRSMLPLLEDPVADWPDRQLFVHCGRWNAGERDAAKYEKCAVRTAQWRFINNSELYNIEKDPGEQKNVAELHPEVVEELRTAYDEWWNSLLPLMVNEGMPRVKRGDMPMAKRYDKQMEEMGIPEYSPDEL